MDAVVSPQRMRWLQKLLWSLLGLLGVSALLALHRRSAALKRANRDLGAISAREAVLELQATRAALTQGSEARSDKIALIDQSIEEHKSRIAAVQLEHGLTAQEISDEFSKLGY